MGSSVSSSMKSLFERREFKTLMVGLTAAGKTTILHGLHAGKVATTTPTIGFNLETLELRRGSRIVSFTSWDFGGRDVIRGLWRHYYMQMNAVVWVADSSDRERTEDAAFELQRMLAEDDLRGVPLLVFANKQDLPGAMSPAEVAESLGLHSISGREWMIQPCCATSGDGVLDGFEWLTGQLEGVDVETAARAGCGRLRGPPDGARKAASEAGTESTADPGDIAPSLRDAPAA
mmetsp:Transcript_2963/g.8387  ORF Transcript_2963/g.8387 Transcript_2963/m.8387 type:complete len:233 (+) Transcript_2963:65-763(+)